MTTDTPTPKTSIASPQTAADRASARAQALEHDVRDHLRFSAMQEADSRDPQALYEALARSVRDRLVARWLATRATYREADPKFAYYLSAEYLLGRALLNNLINLDLLDAAREVVEARGLTLEDLLEREPDPGLGNGGLGRLAACFLDSMATLGLPGVGYGIRYDYGIFEQAIEDGEQVERGDDWLRRGNPWELPRYAHAVTVHFYGEVRERVDAEGRFHSEWVEATPVLGVPYDMPVSGFRTDTVNTLRLWSAKAAKEFNLELFNAGDYRRAVESKALTESISKVLYPSDHSPEGRELRLKQQYFFVACSLADLLRRYQAQHPEGFDRLPEKAHIQLNDTHPAIAVAELMRILVDQEGLDWQRAWRITQGCFGYTNHTLMPEALERWPVPMFERLLPRHLKIIYEINRRFLRQVSLAWPRETDRQRRMSIIEEGPVPQVRMAYLATIGSQKINGVAALHSQLIRSQLLPDFAELWPDRFTNVTNGVTPRRWLLQANPELAALITEAIGPQWPAELERLSELVPFAEDAPFVARVRDIKQHNKRALAQQLKTHFGWVVDPQAIFDVQVKRMHEYKRQLLNVLGIIAHYLDLKAGLAEGAPPRVHLFGGKAAPGYAVAKQHIRLIHDVASTIEEDPAIGDRLRVIFVPNYNVSWAEHIMPATDLSEQISTAGYEASGTGNMKFALNGALTIGTLDGANVEIREAVGEENFYLFGLNAAEVSAQLAATGGQGGAGQAIAESPRLARVLDFLESGFFSPTEPDRYRGLVHQLRTFDRYLVCTDFEAYVTAQARAGADFGDQAQWHRRALLNIARTGHFSSDRSIREYAEQLWGVRPLKVQI